ncbi:MAG: response regulator [Verrucomicrobiales bacterium]|nr:response regulator [Verrucomicrobiales bacterium]
MVTSTYSVLVADDSEDDVMLLREAFRQAPRLRIAHHCRNGKEAILYLRGVGVYADRGQFPFPDLLLLDLKMPVGNGFEVLQWLGRNLFPRLHVVALSDSSTMRDMRRALALGADYYQVKPGTLDKLGGLVMLLERSCTLFQQSQRLPIPANGLLAESVVGTRDALSILGREACPTPQRVEQVVQSMGNW